MSYTIAQYLQALLTQRARLAENLNAKGVECKTDEQYNTLVEKINTIYDTGGLAYGEWMPLTNTDTFTISGLNAKPTSFGLSCERIVEGKLTETGSVFIGVLNYDPSNENVVLYKFLDDGTFVYDTVTTDLLYTVNQEADGTYTVTISFEAFNQMTQKPYLFKGGFEYNWVASSKEWFL